MAISNVETEASKVDYDARTHRSNSKDRNSKTHNAHAKSELGEEPRKEDSVAISEEARQLSEWREQISRLRELKGQEIVHENPLRELSPYSLSLNAFLDEFSATSINNTLQGKLENADELLKKVHDMLTASPQPILGETYSGDRTFEQLESQAAQREVGKNLAAYIAENYLNDPDEAKAFMDAVNKLADEYEKRDENRLERWAESLKSLEEIRARTHAEMAKRGQVVDEATVQARVKQISPEPAPFSETFLDAWQSLVVKGSSVKDWFANFISKIKFQQPNHSQISQQ